MTVTIHGIRNCDTMKKAFSWLDEHGIAYAFHDYKKDGVSEETLRRWCAAAGWEAVINRAGMTYRKLPDDAKTDIDEPNAIALMANQPSMIRRPVLETGGAIEIGFRPEHYAGLFKA